MGGKKLAVRAAESGVTLETMLLLRANGATRAYQEQRRNAGARGIPWHISLGEWWAVWSESGKWAERGRLKGQYVMGRFGDTGAYAVGNVYICDHSENAKIAQSHANRPPPRPHVERTSKGRFMVKYRRQYFGSFATKEAAEAKVARMVPLTA